MSRQRIDRVTILLLVLGLGLAVEFYFASAPSQDDLAMSQISDSKIYQQQVKLLGGDLSLMMANFQHWFSNRWHGRPLAATIAVLTLAVAFSFRFVASHPDYIKVDSPLHPSEPPENQ